MDLTTKTPAEVDALLAPLQGKLGSLYARQQQYRTQARRYEQFGASYATSAARLSAQADALCREIDAADEACEPYRAEYRRRGGWNRIYWCNANGGHGHSTLSCRSLGPGTSMSWIPELSGKDETELVELAGESACTWCFPTAPVEVLSRPSQLRPAVEAREAKAARDAEKATKAAAKAAKGITAVDGSPLRDLSGYPIKSERTAWIEATSTLSDVEAYGYELTEAKVVFVQRIVEALAAKLDRDPVEVRAEIEAKAAAKAKRDRKASEKYARSLGLPV